MSGQLLSQWPHPHTPRLTKDAALSDLMTACASSALQP